MRHAGLQFAAVVLGVSAASLADGGSVTRTDAPWDTGIHRTDLGAVGILNPASRLPDVLSVKLSAWQTPTPVSDPFSGSVVQGQYHLVRIDLVFDGLVNPPGRLGDNVVTPYEPFLFGPSPVYGFLELDLDNNTDTGGELGPAASTTFLANIGRFGRLPPGPIGQRAAVWGTDLQNPWGTAPEFRKTGTDFVLTFCGCFTPEILSEGTVNANHVFEEGETWIVRGPFFQRASGYREASFCFGGASGTPGMYDPLVKLRFSHSTSTNRTTISLVYALDMIGAAQLAGQSPQFPNYNVGDQNSILEALQDVIDALPSVPFQSETWWLANQWSTQDPTHHLDPTDWGTRGLFGTAYLFPRDSNFVWTDTGFDDAPGDVNGSGAGDTADRTIVRHKIVQYDGSEFDGDGVLCENGSVTIINFGTNFCLYDVNGDGVLNDFDVRYYCLADFDGDGRLTTNDFVAFVNAYYAMDPRADLNHNAMFELQDFQIFGNAFWTGCP